MFAGVLGIKVAIMLDHDPSGFTGPSKTQPDVIRVIEPKEEDDIPAPGLYSNSFTSPLEVKRFL